MSAFNKLVQHYMAQQGLDEEGFAEQINQALGEHAPLDKQLVTNWARFDLEPSDTYFKAIIVHFEPGSPDWRVQFAFLALAILKPELFNLENGRMWALALRIVKFDFMNSGAAQETLAKVLEASNE